MTQAISAAAGGSISATLGTQTARVTFAPNSLAANATVTLTLYAAAGLPRAFAAGQRSTRSVPPGAVFIGAVTIDTGSVALTKAPS
ncbi:MAG: hypothetical protein ABR591_12220, partial [Candidatus Velthaea sp.]